MARTIRRYANRKLYDVKASRYVSLGDLLDLIRCGETVTVLDVASGDDITCLVLAQVLLAGERSGRARLPASVLHQIVQRAAVQGAAERRARAAASGSAAPRPAGHHHRADKPAT
jgi:polyhydroxyalkanoate synthesis repressor PhaR